MKLKKIAAAVAVTSLLASGPLLASEPSPEIRKGAASGLVIGAIAGGPVGAFAGTVLGGEVFGRLFEQRRHKKELQQDISNLQAKLETEQARHTELVRVLNQDLDKVLALQASQLKSRKLPVQFRTASSTIEPQYEDELLQIARVLQRNQDASVTLSGFSDRRGDNRYNQQLSESRVLEIKRFLLDQGVAPEQILGIAYGESHPLQTDESLEGNFFDRRVVLDLDLNIAPQLVTR